MGGKDNSKTSILNTIGKTTGLRARAEGAAAAAKKSPTKSALSVYDEDSILHLEGLEHIRLRPGMYIGSLGDGSNENDGIYIL